MCTALNGSYLVQAWNLEEDLSNTRFGVYDYRQTLSCGDYLISESDERPIVVIVFEVGHLSFYIFTISLIIFMNRMIWNLSIKTSLQ